MQPIVERHYAMAPFKELIGGNTFKQWFQKITDDRSHLQALIGSAGRKEAILTYGDLREEVKTLGEILLRMNVKKGDKVVLIGENRIEWVMTYFAVVSIGAIIVPIDPFLDIDEIVELIGKLEATLVFFSDRTLKKIIPHRSRLDKIAHIVCFDAHAKTYGSLAQQNKDDDEDLFAELEKREAKRVRPFKQVEYIYFGSMMKVGHEIISKNKRQTLYAKTKIRPNDPAALIHMYDEHFATLSHKGLLENSRALDMHIDAFSQGHQYLVLLPLHHTFPMMAGCLAPLSSYGTAVIPARFQTRDITRLIEKHKINSVAMVPLLLEAVSKFIEEKKYDLSSLNFFICGGARLEKETIQKMADHGITVLQGYGLTEYSPIVSGTKVDDNPAGSVGKAFPKVKLRIDQPDDDGDGEILIKGPSIMIGYHKMPEETKRTVDGDGWLHSGDIGRLDENSNLTITGRMKRVIVPKGGKNVYPVPMERKLRQSDLIRDAAVVPRFDPKIGEYPMAMIVPSDELISGFSREQQEEAIRNEIKTLFSGSPKYKIPAHFELYNDLTTLEELRMQPFFVAGAKTSDRSVQPSQVPGNRKGTFGAEALDPNDMEAYATRKIARFLKVEASDLNLDDKIFELLDSIELSEIADEVHTELGIELDPTHLFEYTTIGALAGYLAAELKNHPEQFAGRVIANAVSGGMPAGNGSRTQGINQYDENAIAIVGVSGILPGSEDLDDFWRHLVNGDSMITEIPKERFDWRPFYSDASDKPALINTKWGGFIDGIDKFDPFFFKISPKEAVLMDPQQRLMLKCVWHALEDAGTKPSSLSGKKVGVFVGVSTTDYDDVCGESGHEIDVFTSTGLAHSIVANRISYLFNFHGPSEPVDTACSSSLVAIHRSLSAIENEECEIAIAGGVNALLAIKPFAAFSQAGILSPNGRCKTFSSDADGYVRGEGAGAVVLKKLGQAIEDKNQIYAVIRGSAVNHGGKAGSLTAPNPVAQADLLISAYEKANVSPETVGYIEAHGTGTALGDPVEINGLKKAFEELFKRNGAECKRKYCGLGSVKTNIGHLEAAAGIAGIIKILLALKYKQLPPTINFKGKNPLIKIEESPFYIVNQLSQWNCPCDEKGNAMLRRAGISSFGFGGAYAHIVLEEFQESNGCDTESIAKCCLFVLSAKSKKQLETYARNVADFVEKDRPHSDRPLMISDIAYTSQVGREEMPVRMAAVVEDMSQLVEVLRRFAAGADGDGEWYFNDIRNSGRDVVKHPPFPGDCEKVTYEEADSLQQIAGLWISGRKIDWQRLNAGNPAKLVSLPAYPFEEKRYWVDFRRPTEARKYTSFGDDASESPLLDSLPSGDFTIKYTKKLDTKHFYLQDHMINEQHILPGAMHVEMAKAAGQNATRKIVADLEEVFFTNPVIVADGGTEVTITIVGKGGQVTFQIGAATDGKEEVVYSHGKLLVQEELEPKKYKIDLAHITATVDKTMDPQKFYRQAADSGMKWGKTFQVIQDFRYNDHVCLARLDLPDQLKTDSHIYGLHPALFDGAMQAVGMWCNKDGRDLQAGVLAHLGKVSIFSPLTDQSYVVVSPVNPRGTKFSIKICDAQGKMIVDIQNMFYKALPRRQYPVEAAKIDPTYLSYQWVYAPLHQEPGTITGPLIIFDTSDVLADRFEAENQPAIVVKPAGEYRRISKSRYEIDPANASDYIRLIQSLKDADIAVNTIIHLWSYHENTAWNGDSGRLEAHLTLGARCLLHLSKALMQSKAGTAVRLILCAHESRDMFSPQVTAAAGFMQAIAHENPLYKYKMVRLDKTRTSTEVLAQVLAAELDYYDSIDVKYDGMRQGRQLAYVWERGLENPLKKNGVYLITGGAGAIGRIVSQYLIETYNAKILALGRSDPNNVELPDCGNDAPDAHYVYCQVDIADINAFKESFDQLRKAHGPINGVIHCAGLTRDDFIFRKNIQDFNHVLLPKIQGTIHLDAVTRDEPLSFFIMFSSITSVFGNAGQCDYAVANRFMDEFSLWRTVMVQRKERSGKTTAINWPLWREGRMRIDESVRSYLEKTFGLQPIENVEGINAFQEGLAQPLSQLVVFKGDIFKQDIVAFEQFGNKKAPEIVNALVAARPTAFPSDDLQKSAETFLTSLLASEVGVSADQIHPNEELDNLGIDSRVVVKLNTMLERDFGKLPKTLFFEYLSIRELAKYFLDHHGGRLKAILDFRDGSVNDPATEVISENETDSDKAPQHMGDGKTLPKSANTAGVVMRIAPERSQGASIEEMSKEQLHELTCGYFVDMLSKELSIASTSIDVRDDFENFGIDSRLITKFNSLLENEFGKLPKTLFFEYLNINELAHYFVENHRDRLKEKFAETPRMTDVSDRHSSVFIESRGNGHRPAPEEGLRDDVAIIGISCCLPGANDMNQFWRNLIEGKDSIVEIPKRCFDIDIHFSKEKKNGYSYCKWGGFIEDVNKFDPLFFNISPNDANLMDPQQRLFLQTAWHAIEDAGYTLDELHRQTGRRVGVFVGATWTEYQFYTVQGADPDRFYHPDIHLFNIPNRVSYHFGFQGPSIAIDTACAASLTAIQMACESLKNGSSRLAIAGGVNLSLHRNKYINLSQNQFLSVDGRCKSFAESANGYVPGEGVGALLLKPYARAVKDKDNIYGVIIGSSSNHGGKTNGYSVPNPNAQADLICEALDLAGINPRTISYVEAHGTGTSLGDPIEIRALEKAFRKYTDDRQYCAIGSCKSNIGHLEAAAGIAQVAKVLLQLKYKKLAPSIHVESISPLIDFENSPFYVQTSGSDWQDDKERAGSNHGTPRRAAISSFGAGGANTHIIVEEYNPAPELEGSEDLIIPEICVLSAESPAQLAEYAAKMKAFAEKGNACLRDIAHTMRVGRQAFDERLAFTASSRQEFVRKLAGYCDGKPQGFKIYSGKKQHTSETNNDDWYTVQFSDDYFENQGHLEKLAEHWVKGADVQWCNVYPDNKAKRISLPTYPFAREACWLPQESLGRNGDRNSAVLHPLIDENTSTLDAFRYRKQFTGQEFFFEDHVIQNQKLLPGAVYLEMARAAGTLAIEGDQVKRLRNIVWMNPLVANGNKPAVNVELKRKAGTVAFEIKSSADQNSHSAWLHSRGEIECLSMNPTGAGAVPDYDFWSEKSRLTELLSADDFYRHFKNRGFDYGHSFRTVKRYYSDGRGMTMAELQLDAGVESPTEVILHPAIVDGALQTVAGAMLIENDINNYLPFTVETVDIMAPVTQKCFAMAEKKVSHGEAIRRFDVGLYDQDGQLSIYFKNFVVKKMVLQDEQAPYAAAHAPAHETLVAFKPATGSTSSVTKTASHDEYYIKDHKVYDRYIFPAVGFLELARAAAQTTNHTPVAKLCSTTWMHPLELKENGNPIDVSIAFNEKEQKRYFTISSHDDAGKEAIHCQGRVELRDASTTAVQQSIDLDRIKSRLTTAIDPRQAYQLCEKLGLRLGPSLRAIDSLHIGDNEALAALTLPDQMSLEHLVLHPSLLTGALGAEMSIHSERSRDLYLPFTLKELEILKPLTRRCFVHARQIPSRTDEIRKADLQIADPNGQVLVHFKELISKKLDSADQAVGAPRIYYRSKWMSQPLATLTERQDTRNGVLLFGKKGALVDRFRARLQNVVLVEEGDMFAALGTHDLILNPYRPEDFARLVDSLEEHRLDIQTVIYLWPHAQPDGGIDLIHELDRSIAVGPLAMFNLCKALSHSKKKQKIKIIFAFHAQDGRAHPANSAVAGFFNALQLENRYISGKTVCLDSPRTRLDENAYDLLVAEMASPEDTATEVLYKNGQRQVLAVTPFDLEAVAGPVIQTGGVYLITGGAGGLGLIFARHLLETYDARLILTGRSNRDDAINSRIAAIDPGLTRVIYLDADICDYNAVTALIEKIRKRYGRLNGIVHSAGIIDDSLIAKKAVGSFQHVLAPKVHGTVNLDDCTKNEALDFFVLFSSVTAIGGNIGQTDYAAANRFLDAFACYRNDLVDRGIRKGHTIGMNWPLWEHGGFKVDAASRELLKTAGGMDLLDTGTGLRAFDDALRTHSEQLIVLPGDKAKLYRTFKIQDPGAIQPQTTETAPVHSVHTVEADARTLMQALREEMIVEIIKQTGVSREKLDIKADLAKFGFDSIKLTNFGNEINRRFDIEITPAIFFEYNSVEAISEYLIEEYPRELARVLLKDKHVDSAQTHVRKHQAVILSKAPTFDQRSRISGDTVNAGQDIAIIGMSGIFPESSDLKSFWRNLEAGKDMITEIPADRFDWHRYHSDHQEQAANNRINTKWGGFIKGIDQFDAAFFGITPAEAEVMDPQQRKLLEVVWAAIEDAGYNAAAMSGSNTGVFIGVEGVEYSALQTHYGEVLDPQPHSATGTGLSIVANRISYTLNLTGPSQVISTACSSSMTAIDSAIKAIAHSDCDMALAGGVTTLLTPYYFMLLGQLGVLSPDGRCRTFDKDANGYVRGEGIGVVMLKPMHKALQDKDNIIGVIKGIAINHGGKANSISSPNPKLQAEVIVKAHERAAISPDTITYVETHGTATGLGDPVEINGLKKAFKMLHEHYGLEQQNRNYCGLGSVKSNIGHLEPASSIAGIIKILLAFKHKKIPATINFTELNPYIQIKDSPFYIVDQTSEWQPTIAHDGSPVPRRACASGFGYGGAYCHIVLEEYNPARGLPAAPQEQEQIFVLSAKSKDRLKAYAQRLIDFLEDQEAIKIAARSEDINAGWRTLLPHIAYTLQLGRVALNHRLAVTAASAQNLIARLKAFCHDASNTSHMIYGKVKTNLGGQTDAPIDQTQGADMQRLIRIRDLAALAMHWTQGASVEWQELHDMSVVHRISLPTYPFEEKRFWINDGMSRLNVSTASPDTAQVKEASRKSPIEIGRPGGAHAIDPPHVKTKHDAPPQLYHITVEKLTEVVSQTTKIPADEIEPDIRFDEYGFDSITVNAFNSILEKKISGISKTVLFEKHTIQQLAEYLVESHADQLTAMLAEEGRWIPTETEKVSDDASYAGQKNEGEKSAGPPERQEAGQNSIQVGGQIPFPGAMVRNGDIPGLSGATGGIAVIGMSGKYPGAENLEAFWENLASGNDCVGAVPEYRWDHSIYYDPDPGKAFSGTCYCPSGGFLGEDNLYDPLFFNISPMELQGMDPQELLFLETVWAAFEDAGYTRSKFSRFAQGKNGYNVGVFVGASILSNPMQWSIANRVSYFFDFMGPSISVDTACSSSMTSLFLACESLRKGECRLAVAGGVSILPHPMAYIQLSAQRMLSQKGKCFSFGAEADGFVPGEGVGAVLLKPIEAAQRDNDRIIGVIRAISVNHGGAVNGYTVPNPNAQAELIAGAIGQAGVNPRAISYVEAHAAGTSLGDPIEVRGLTMAFSRFTQEKQFCPIGTVKTNIGHPLAASGIAGLTKVLLQLKHKKIAPSLHAENLNRKINFIESPFYVQKKAEEWKKPEIVVNGTKKKYNRIAAISSFGVGGANAHAIVEEYDDNPKIEADAQPEKNVIVLSAKNTERLRWYATEMARFLKRQSASDAEEYTLTNVAYTLQTGREPMEERLAFVASDLNVCAEKLERFAAGEGDYNQDIYRGNSRTKRREMKFLLDDEDTAEMLHQWALKQKTDKLAKFWIDGADIDWQHLYQNGAARIVHLPTYPFAREHRCPGLHVMLAQFYAVEKVRHRDDRRHPLIGRSISTDSQPKFITRFTGNEFYLRDHVVNGTKIMPGVCYLEMALAAAKLSRIDKIRTIKNVIWGQAIAVHDKPVEVRIELTPGKNKAWDYQVFSEDRGEMTPHSHGRLQPEDKADIEKRIPQHFDIDAIKARCPETIDGGDFYQLTESIGNLFGPSLQAICEMHVNDHETLAKLHLPQSQRDDFEAYVIHPSIMDAVLTAVSPLVFRNAKSVEPHVAFSVEELTILHPIEEKAYAHVTLSSDEEARKIEGKRFTIALSNESGQVAAYIRDFTVRPAVLLSDSQQIKPLAPQRLSETMYFRREWQSVDAEEEAGQSEHQDMNIAGAALIFGSSDALWNELNAQMKSADHAVNTILIQAGQNYKQLNESHFIINPDHKTDYSKLFEYLRRKKIAVSKVVHAWADEQKPTSKDSITSQLNIGIYSLFHLTKEIIRENYDLPVHIIFVHPIVNNTVQPQHSAVSGFMKTAQQEHQSLRYKNIELNSALELREKCKIIGKELGRPFDPNIIDLRFDTEAKYIKRNVELSREEARAQMHEGARPLPLKKGGCYVITGGLGGLGYIFIQYLAKKEKINLVLIGRSKLTPKKQQQLQELNQFDATVIYKEQDITDMAGIKVLMKQIVEKYGEINGILHMAGVMDDSFIVNKSIETMARVIKPKLSGALNLDEATKNQNLDFFVLFSSIAAIMPNVGQCDYAYANNYLNAFAEQRSRMEMKGERSGRTIAVNWPLWQDGGMKMDAQVERLMEKHVGLKAMPTNAGLSAFEDAFVYNEHTFVVVEGFREKAVNFVLKGQKAEDAEMVEIDQDALKNMDQDAALNRVKQDMCHLVATILKVSGDEIQYDRGMMEYGFNSLTLMHLAGKIYETFNIELSPSDFFENTTIDSFSEALFGKHKMKFLAHYYGKEVSSGAEPSINETDESADAMDYQEQAQWDERKELSVAESETPPADEEKIKLVGSFKWENAEEYFRRLKEHGLTTMQADTSQLTQSNILDLVNKNGDLFNLLVKTSSGRSLEALLCGHGRPILLIPGLGHTAPIFSNQIKQWYLSNKIIVINKPGHGLSDKIKRLSLEQISHDINDVLNGLEIETPIHVIGTSLGGMVAQYFTKAYQERVATLTLSNSFCQIKGNLKKDIPSKALSGLGDMSLHYTQLLESELDAISKTAKNLLTNTERKQHEALIELSKNIDPFSSMVYLEQAQSFNTIDILTKIKVPTLVIGGCLDRFVELTEQKLLYSKLSNSTYLEIPDAGHFPYITCPEMFNQKVIEFIESNS